jgi:hypothetical protein
VENNDAMIAANEAGDAYAIRTHSTRAQELEDEIACLVPTSMTGVLVQAKLDEYLCAFVGDRAHRLRTTLAKNVAAYLTNTHLIKLSAVSDARVSRCSLRARACPEKGQEQQKGCGEADDLGTGTVPISWTPRKAAEFRDHRADCGARGLESSLYEASCRVGDCAGLIAKRSFSMTIAGTSMARRSPMLQSRRPLGSRLADNWRRLPPAGSRPSNEKPKQRWSLPNATGERNHSMTAR